MEGLTPRFVESALADACADTPVVVVQGPRQCGKTTLVQQLDLPYVTLDDGLALDAATSNPEGWLAAYDNRLIIDEVQRAPTLARAIKARVDKRRLAGSFVLTGSTNILLLPRLADSLAGRMEVITLWPLSWAEMNGSRVSFADRVFTQWPPKLHAGEYVSADEIAQRILAGGFPEPMSRAKPQRREAWFQAYVRALLDRDVRDLAEIEGLNQLPRLLRSLVRSLYEPTNVLALSRETGIAATTLTRYLSLLEGVFLVKSIPAWTALGSGKAAKTARLAVVDSGVACHLDGVRVAADLAPAHWENAVVMELTKQLSWSQVSHEVMHFRSIRQYALPAVLQAADGRLVGVSVCTSAVASPSDFKALEYFADVAGDDFHAGVVLTMGNSVQRVSEKLTAMPVSALFERSFWTSSDSD